MASPRQRQWDLSSHYPPGSGMGSHPSQSLTLCLSFLTGDLVLPRNIWVRRQSREQWTGEL